MDTLPAPEEVRAKAAEIRQRAAITSDPNKRKALLVVAAEYERLADVIEEETANLSRRAS